jgi:hypothetical protein
MGASSLNSKASKCGRLFELRCEETEGDGEDLGTARNMDCLYLRQKVFIQVVRLAFERKEEESLDRMVRIGVHFWAPERRCGSLVDKEPNTEL